MIHHIMQVYQWQQSNILQLILTKHCLDKRPRGGWLSRPNLLSLLSLTKEGRRGNRAVATGDHDTDASLHKRYWEVHHLWSLLVDGERADGHISTLIHHLAQKIISHFCIISVLKCTPLWFTQDRKKRGLCGIQLRAETGDYISLQ